MKKTPLAVAMATLLFNAPCVFANSDVEAIKQQLHELKASYEQRIKTLESRLSEMENQQESNHQAIKQVSNEVEQSQTSSKVSAKQSDFNPGISLILNGLYSNYTNTPDNYQLPGFMLGDEAGLEDQGLSLGESELTLSSNIDDKFYGQVTMAFGGAPDATDVSIEEAFFQTTALGNGLTLKGGRFFSAVGYLNEQHAHAWDFSDAPLIYRGLFGNQLVNDGLQASYLFPTDQYMQLGAEISSGSHYPSAGNHHGVGSWSLFYNIGGDIGISQSWQLGLNHWQADRVSERESAFLGDSAFFSGHSKINSADFVYKWSPNGNPINQNFKFQFEYFDRKENGQIAFNAADTAYNGHQKGLYAQAIYQFMPQWKTGFRYDWINSNNSGANLSTLVNTGLADGYSPKRYSLMLEWLSSNFSRFRLQYNRDKSYQVSDNQVMLQYTFSLGAHGAHQY